jgi:hypothetical protein
MQGKPESTIISFFLWEIERHSSLGSKKHVTHLREQNKPKEGLPP